jgi:hypothetical protein
LIGALVDPAASHTAKGAFVQFRPTFDPRTVGDRVDRLAVRRADGCRSLEALGRWIQMGRRGLFISHVGQRVVGIGMRRYGRLGFVGS